MLQQINKVSWTIQMPWGIRCRSGWVQVLLLSLLLFTSYKLWKTKTTPIQYFNWTSITKCKSNAPFTNTAKQATKVPKIFYTGNLNNQCRSVYVHETVRACLSERGREYSSLELNLLATRVPSLQAIHQKEQYKWNTCFWPIKKFQKSSIRAGKGRWWEEDIEQKCSPNFHYFEQYLLFQCTANHLSGHSLLSFKMS